MSKQRRLPKWLSEHAQKCKQAFGLQAWAIDVSQVDNLQVDGSKAVGLHETNYRTLESDITYDARLAPNDYGYSTITHEFLHVALIQYDVAFRSIMDFVPKKHRDHCLRIHTDHKEHTIERMARSLSPMLRTVARGQEK